MTTVEELFDSENTATEEIFDPDDTFDREAYKKRKDEERRELFEIADVTALEICTSAEKLRSYLDVQARFLNHLATNALLITAQMPSARLLREYDEWKAMGAIVRRGGKWAKILKAGNEYTRGDGTKGNGWVVKRVYDVSQTTEPDRYSAPDLKLDPEQLMRCLLKKSPVRVVASDSLPDGMRAFYSHETSTILVRRFRTSADVEITLREMFSEEAQAEIAYGNDNYDRESAADTALCVSYILAHRHGLDTSSYDLEPVLAHLSGDTYDSREIRGELSLIRKTAFDIGNRIDKSRTNSKESQDTDNSSPDDR